MSPAAADDGVTSGDDAVDGNGTADNKGGGDGDEGGGDSDSWGGREDGRGSEGLAGPPGVSPAATDGGAASVRGHRSAVQVYRKGE